ncbi:MAG: MBL fold metallo-hydrolase [Coxiellaceae bacterium]|nr:MAG: MBL fold metallo-hydrolase [Coxiellaceae bacterium]
MLVDCGLFQGYKELRLRNWSQLPLDPATVHAVVLTHSHIDHSGYIPLLVKNGFKGRIYCSEATRDLCSILLPDSGYLQEEEARLANLWGYSKHKPALPLYTREDAENSLSNFSPVHFGTEYSLPDELSFKLMHAGHIMGASMLELRYNQLSWLFTGDLGRPNDPIMTAPATVQYVDYLVTESTYGDRSHGDADPMQELANIINQTVKQGGSVIVPAFAVGRAQSLLYYIYHLKKKQWIPDIPVYLDSPMAVNATKVFYQHANETRLSHAEALAICSHVTYIDKIEESQALDESKMPMILISASGMATGGRVLHHLAAFLPDHRNTVLFTGYQAGGTRGDRLMKGETEVKIHGKMVPVRARVTELDNMSAHVDADEMIAWLAKFTKPPRKIFLTHGEPNSATALQQRIKQELHWDCEVPTYLQTVTV